MKLNELNMEQMEAVMETEGHIRLVAGAGTGKTRTLACRFAWLTEELGILPANILAVTFTNKAAAEMRQRIHSLTGDNDTGLVCTFHGLCNTILSEEIHAAAYPKSFIVLDNGDINDILDIIYDQRGLTLRHMTYAKARDMIEMRKCQIQPDYYLDLIRMDLDTLKQKYANSQTTEDIIFNGYLYHAKKVFALDYNDLITFTLYIFETCPAIKKKWQDRLEYIMIDEFQDIDELQARLMKVLEGGHHNLFVVGDPDQTIYTWRGARLRYLLDFDNEFPETKTITLHQNYRSTPQILAAASSLVACNTRRIDKTLDTENAAGAKPRLFCGQSSAEEAKRIIRHIKDLTDTGECYADIAILYRAHYMSRIFEDELRKEGIPYTLVGGLAFYDRQEIKDAHAWLRMLQAKDDLSFLRTINRPRRNIGRTRLAFLKTEAENKGRTLYQTLKDNIDDPRFKNTGAHSYIEIIENTPAENRSISEILSQILNESGYEEMLRTNGAQDRLDNLAELKQAIHEYEITAGEEAGLEHYLRHITLLAAQDQPVAPDTIRLMTIHTAKGLEFDHVILACVNENMFPARKTRTLEAMEEERRLCFVAMTRAKKTLLLTCSQGKRPGNNDLYPSRFMTDIHPDTVLYEPDETWARKASIRHANSRFAKAGDDSLFGQNTRILHPIFGYGTILAEDSIRQQRTIQFDKLATPRTLSFKARLQKEDEPGRLN